MSRQSVRISSERRAFPFGVLRPKLRSPHHALRRHRDGKAARLRASSGASVTLGHQVRSPCRRNRASFSHSPLTQELRREGEHHGGVVVGEMVVSVRLEPEPLVRAPVQASAARPP